MARRALGTLRIIGGHHRSRLIQFDADNGVRPTPDRVRQTVFDWLAPIIHGAKVVDLFAGSGALGLEAASRGAHDVTFVENQRGSAAAIREAMATLKLERVRVAEQDALGWLSASTDTFDVVFLDPPYGSDLLTRALERLPRCLNPGAMVYLEWPSGQPPTLPQSLSVHRERQAGKVCFALLKQEVLHP